MSVETLLRPRKLDSSEGPARVDESSLPAELVDRGLKRLGLLALMLAGGTVLELLIGDTIKYVRGDIVSAAEQRWDYVAVTVLTVTSLLMYAAVRRRWFSRSAFKHVGSAYLVLTAFFISFGDHSDTFWLKQPGLYGIPWTCLVILLVPMMVPLSSRRTVLTGSAMAAMGPIAMWAITNVMRVPPPTPSTYFDIFFVQFIVALLALVPARIVNRLGVELGKARRLGAYQLDERIGQGAMGEVWRARHRFLARPAAVKLIQAKLLGRADSDRALQAFRRFEREAQATASLRSPHTIQLYDFGRTDDGTLYYAMELLEGFDLETFVERFGPLPPARVVPWLAQMGQSLREAHEVGLVHRDIKPANVFVCRYGSEVDFIKVLDFGLVSLQPASNVEHDRITTEREVRGTPAYMPPEVATGDSIPDARSDIYSLGCVAYWLLTGSLVFSGKNAVEVMVAHVERTPTSPSELCEHELPAELERLVLDCLAKAPEDRPESATEVARRLEDIALTAPWTDAAAREWWGTHAPASSAD